MQDFESLINLDLDRSLSFIVFFICLIVALIGILCTSKNYLVKGFYWYFFSGLLIAGIATLLLINASVFNQKDYKEKLCKENCIQCPGADFIPEIATEKCISLRKELDKDLMENARSNITASEAILFGTITIFLFVLFSLWSNFVKEFELILQKLNVTGTEDEKKHASEIKFELQEFKESAKFPFSMYVFYIFLLASSVFSQIVPFLVWALLPIYESLSMTAFQVSLLIKHLAGLSVIFSLILLFAYIHLIHPILGDLEIVSKAVEIDEN